MARTCCFVVLSIVPAGDRAWPGRTSEEMRRRRERRNVKVSIGLLQMKETRSNEGGGEDGGFYSVGVTESGCNWFF